MRARRPLRFGAEHVSFGACVGMGAGTAGPGTFALASRCSASRARLAGGHIQRTTAGRQRAQPGSNDEASSAFSVARGLVVAILRTELAVRWSALLATPGVSVRRAARAHERVEQPQRGRAAAQRPPLALSGLLGGRWRRPMAATSNDWAARTAEAPTGSEFPAADAGEAGPALPSRAGRAGQRVNGRAAHDTGHAPRARTGWRDARRLPALARAAGH